MTKTPKKSNPEDGVPVPPVQRFFIPGHGEIEATDINEAVAEAVKLQEQEDGDGNR